MEDIAELRKAIYNLEIEITRLQEQLKASADALGKQAIEYERRLAELNHARSQAKEALATYVPREVYERKIEENNVWKRGVDKELDTNRGRNAMLVSVIAAIGALAAFVGTILNYIWQIFGKQH